MGQAGLNWNQVCGEASPQITLSQCHLPQASVGKYSWEVSGQAKAVSECSMKMRKTALVAKCEEGMFFPHGTWNLGICPMSPAHITGKCTKRGLQGGPKSAFSPLVWAGPSVHVSATANSVPPFWSKPSVFRFVVRVLKLAALECVGWGLLLMTNGSICHWRFDASRSIVSLPIEFWVTDTSWKPPKILASAALYHFPISFSAQVQLGKSCTHSLPGRWATSINQSHPSQWLMRRWCEQSLASSLFFRPVCQ